MLTKKGTLWIAATCLVLMTAGYYWWGSLLPERSQPRMPLTFATVPAIVEAPSHIAYDNGFFADEGLDVSLKMNSDGKTSLDQLFAGEADIASVMGTPVVYSSFGRDDFYILGKIAHSKIHFVVARKDRGIQSASDLKGKKVAVMHGTSGEFFMDSFLLFNGLKHSDIEIVNLNAPAMVLAIEKGEVDAIFCWSPFPLLVQKKLGENALVLPSENIVPGSWLIVARKKFVQEHPRTVRAFLTGLMKGEKFIRENKEESIAIHSQVSGVDQDIVATLFETMDFDLTLDQALLVDLENQARWLIRRGYTAQTEVPDYLELIYPDALSQVKPTAVTLIR